MVLKSSIFTLPETNDLALDNKYSDIVQKFYVISNSILDPKNVNKIAFQDQERKIRESG